MTKSEFWRQVFVSTVQGFSPGLPEDGRSVSEEAAGVADLALAAHEARFPGVLVDDPPRDGAHTSTGASPYACPQCGSVSACDHVPF